MQDGGDASPGLLALFGGVALASFAAWAWILGRWRARRPPVEFESRRPVPWGLVDALLILGIWWPRLTWVGALASFAEGMITLEPSPGRSIRFPLDQVEKANLKFEW